MKNIINVFTGEVKTGRINDILVSGAIGSCVVVVIFDPQKESGGMAHIMLPGKAPEHCSELKTRFAEDGIGNLLEQMKVTGDAEKDLCACVVGGGNVLKRDDDSICRNNIKSVLQILKDNNIEPMEQVLGGTIRRAVKLDIELGRIYISEDGSRDKILWRCKKCDNVNSENNSNIGVVDEKI